MNSCKKCKFIRDPCGCDADMECAECSITELKERTERETNEIVKQIEIAIRTKKKGWNNRRFNSLQAEFIRQIIWKHKIGKIVCKKCLTRTRDKKKELWSHPRAKYCCVEHKGYYQRITYKFYFKQEPWKRGDGDSIDHILPIVDGGLEFDRDNLQWMDLKENIRKSGGLPAKRRLETAKERAKQRQLAPIPPPSKEGGFLGVA
jgi:hypothetical protein